MVFRCWPKHWGLPKAKERTMSSQQKSATVITDFKTISRTGMFALLLVSILLAGTLCLPNRDVRLVARFNLVGRHFVPGRQPRVVLSSGMQQRIAPHRWRRHAGRAGGWARYLHRGAGGLLLSQLPYLQWRDAGVHGQWQH